MSAAAAMLMHTRSKVVGIAYGSAEPVLARTVAQNEVGTYAITIAAGCTLLCDHKKGCECEIRKPPLH